MNRVNHTEHVRKFVAERGQHLANVVAVAIDEGRLEELDRIVRAEVLELGDDMHAAAAEAAAAQAAGDVVPCHNCGATARLKQMRPVTVRTTLTGAYAKRMHLRASGGGLVGGILGDFHGLQPVAAG